jgi:hypothetical protein
MTTTVDLLIHAGATFARGLAITDPDGAVDGTWSAKAQIRTATGVLLHDLEPTLSVETVTLPDDTEFTGPVVRLTIPAETTAGFPPRTYLWDLFTAAPGGEPTRLVAQGSVVVDAKVTA